MIKYVEFDSFDDTGVHIAPVNSLYDLNKTASCSYSPEIMKVIQAMKRREDRYYVVINALGSYEVWGSNRNGDAFPEEGLTHLSLRTDMGTPNDYGFKTFEYYAKWFKNHVNKPTSPSFGEVIFSYWNPALHRVELIVAIDRVKDAKTIEALENGDIVSVSMGARVPFDSCSICGNKAKTRKEYCKHARDHLGEIVTPDMARTWSRELGKNIIPGMQVFLWNFKPRFFDISNVHIGADRTAYVLGKAASKSTRATSSLDVPEAYGITDEDVDKIATVRKSGEIDKQVGGALGPNDIDGTVSKDPYIAIPKAVEDKVKNSIDSEPTLPKDFLNGIAKTRSIQSILSTMLGMGIFPKPVEVQRIVLINIGKGDLADKLDSNGEVFDYNDNSEAVDISGPEFDDSLSRLLVPYLAERSACPHYLLPRMDYVDKKDALEKKAYYSSTMGNDYWIDQDPKIGIPQKSIISPSAAAMAGIAAIYAGLKAKSMGINAQDMAKIFTQKPWLAAVIGGSVMYSLYNAMQDPGNIGVPASEFVGRLQNTNFTGHVKAAGSAEKAMKIGGAAGRGLIAAAVALPTAYFANAAQQKSYATKGRPAFPFGGEINPKHTAIAAGATVGLTPLILEAIKKKK